MNLTERDRNLIWHPFTQMQLYPDSIPIVRGEGSTLHAEDGAEYIDAISSWWVNVHGHAHPHVAKAIASQAEQLEQVIFAGFTHPPAVELAEKIVQKLPDPLSHVFFSDNGSTAVEVALKMCIQYQKIRGSKRNRIVALEHAYHGDTFGAMSVGSRSLFTDAWADYLFEVTHVKCPYPGDESVALECLEQALKGDDVAAFIYEPLVQGAAGMQMHHRETLRAMLQMARDAGACLIADEVMVGFGRTGTLFATEQLAVAPDMICLSKGLTGGFLPLGLTVCSDRIYSEFLSEDRTKTFFHSHSFTANPISCAAAVASLELFEQDITWQNVDRIQSRHEEFASKISNHPRVTRLRQCGTILAFDLKTEEKTSYLNTVRDQIYQFALSKRVLIRPLGNIVYVLPPYCTTDAELSKIYQTVEGILALDFSEY